MLKLTGILTLSVFVISCDKDDDDDVAAEAQVMVVHASPNAPAVDVRINNAVALSSVAYPTNSAYTPLPAGPSFTENRCTWQEEKRNTTRALKTRYFFMGFGIS